MNNKTLSNIPGRMYVVFTVAFTVLPFLVIYFLPARTNISLFGEDKFFEWLSAFAWFLAALLFGIALMKGRRQTGRGAHPIWYLGLLAITFIAAGEEISWGQRLFNYETPTAISRSNLQGEMNLHNLKLLDVRVTTDGEQKTGVQRWLTFGRIGSLIWIGFLIFLPLAHKFITPLARLFDWLRLPVPPVQVAVMGLTGYASFSIINTLNGSGAVEENIESIQFVIRFAINEYKETVVAVLFLYAATALSIDESSAPATKLLPDRHLKLNFARV